MPIKTRMTYLLDQSKIKDTDTVIQDLTVKMPISAIDVKVRADNGATSNTLEGLHLDVNTIEVIDGGNTITSLNAGQILGSNFYQLKSSPPYDFNEGGGAKQYLTARLLFGRWIGDPDYYLDPTMFKNPQLRVKVSLTISATAGYTSDTGDISVILHLIEEGARPRKGTIRMIEHEEYTSLASGTVTTELPTDEVVRRLYVRAREPAVDFDTDITKLLLRANRTIRLIDNVRVIDWYDIVGQRYGLSQVEKRLLGANDDVRDLPIGKIKEVDVSAAASATNALIDAISGGRVTLDVYDLATPTAITALTPIRCIAKGFTPFHVLSWDFGDPNDPDTWFDAREYDILECILEQGGAGATVEVYTERILV